MSKEKFINQWLRHFAKNISKDDLEKYVKNQFIWHIFSFGLIDEKAFLVGDAARLEYNSADKSNCIFCDFYGSNGVTDVLLEEYSLSEKIDSNVTELYVVSKDFSWTYIKTHENDLCGPYFMKIS